MRLLFTGLALLIAACSPGAPSPSPAPLATAVAATPATPATPAPTTAAASVVPSVPPGFVRVTFKLRLTGGGSGAATMGVEVTEPGKGPVAAVLCNSPAGDPPCQENRSFETTFDLPEGATVEYVWFQDLAPDGSDRLYFHRNLFVVSPSTVERTIEYDIQA